MRILFLITKGTWGGATKYVFETASYLAKEDGIEVAVAYGTKGILSEKLSEENIPQFHLDGLVRDINPIGELRAYKNILSVIDEFEPDIVHVNSSKGGLGALAARMKGRKVIFTVHGWAFNEKRNLFSKLIFKLAYLTTIFLSHKTILVSDALKKQIVRWPFQKKLVVIPNGIDTEIKFLSKEVAREELGKKYKQLAPHLQKKWIMTIAELHESKGVDIALSALVSLRESGDTVPHYIVFGEGDARWKIEKLIESYKLQDQVHLMGFVDNASKYLEAADLFILPSRTEALGYVLLEAGLAKVPVIATRVGGIPEIIEQNTTGLLVPPDTGSVLSVAINSLLKDVVKQKEFSKNLHEKIISNFSLEDMVQKTKKIYFSLSHVEGLPDEHHENADA